MEYPTPSATIDRRWLLRTPVSFWISVVASLGLLLAGLFLGASPVAAAGPTPVSGPINATTTWTLANSPYIVTGDVSVQTPAVLTIEPGVEVRFDASTELRVTTGQLIAEGTVAEPITFTANTATPTRNSWDGLKFDATSLPNSLRYCLVQYAGTAIASGDSDEHIIAQCTLRYNGNGGNLSSGGAINSEGDYMVIVQNRIYDNELGLRLRKSFNNEIDGNEIYNNDGFGIGFIVDGGPGGSYNLVANNQIHDNGDDGLRLDDGTENVIEDNQIVDNDGHGVWVKAERRLQMVRNVVRGNGLNGLTWATPNFVPLTIHSNVLCNNDGFQIKNLVAASIKAEGNWFGTNTPGAAAVSGLVDYSPWIQMDVAVVPNHLPADGVSTANLSVTMQDGAGHAVPDGYTLDVSPDTGSLSPSTLTLAGGLGTATYTAGTVSGDVEVQVTDLCASLPFTGRLTLDACLDLAVSKDDGAGLGLLPWPDKAYLITYTLTYTNDGCIDAAGVVLTDSLPAGTQFHAGAGWSCNGATCQYGVGPLPLETVDTAPPLVVRVVPASLSGCAALVNKAEIGDDGSHGPDGNADNDSFSLSTTLPCLPDLVLTKTAEPPGCVGIDERITYTLVYTNAGLATATGTILTEALPAHTSYVGSGWTCTGSSCTRDAPNVAKGGSSNAEFVVQVTGPLPEGTITNIAQIGNAEGDIDPRDNQVQTWNAVCGSNVDLQVSKAAGELIVDLNKDYFVEYTITVSNTGEIAATGVMLTDELPVGTTYSGSGWNCVGGECSHAIGGLAPSASLQVPLRLRLTKSQLECPIELSNVVRVADDGTHGADGDPDDNEFTLASTFECLPDFSDSYLPLILKGYMPPTTPTPTSTATPTPSPTPTPSVTPTPSPTPTPKPTGKYLSDVAVNSDTNRVYVSSPAQDAVLAIDPTGAGQVLAVIPVGQDPGGLAVVTTSNKIYAANFGSWTVTAIQGSDNTRLVDLNVGAQPCRAAADSADKRVYVTSHVEPEKGAAAINSQTDTVEYQYTRLQAAPGRCDIDVDPTANKLFIASRDGGLIAIQDAYQPNQDPRIVKLEPSRAPYVLAFNPMTKHLFVTAPEDNRVVVLAPYNIQWNKGKWVTWQGQQAFVLDRTNAGWIKEITVGSGAEEGIAVNPKTGYVYVTNSEDNTVSVIKDSSTTSQIQWVKDIAVGERPLGVDVNVNTNRIFVGNAESRDLTVIDGATHMVAKTIPLD